MKSFNNLKHNDKDRRSHNYKQLKDAGFNSYEANRFKDFSLEKINSLIAVRKDYNVALNKMAGDSND